MRGPTMALRGRPKKNKPMPVEYPSRRSNCLLNLGGVGRSFETQPLPSMHVPLFVDLQETQTISPHQNVNDNDGDDGDP